MIEEMVPKKWRAHMIISEELLSDPACEDYIQMIMSGHRSNYGLNHIEYEIVDIENVLSDEDFLLRSYEGCKAVLFKGCKLIKSEKK